MIRSVEFIAEALGNSLVCPERAIGFDCGDNCTVCWERVLKGVIKDYETKILQSEQDITEKSKV